jgi:hypothetical protein
MLEVQVTGDQHPKTFTVVSDDAEAENARFGDLLESSFGTDDDLTQEWLAKSPDSDGCLRMIVPSEAAEVVGDTMVEESDWPEEGQKILDTIKDGYEQAERALEAASEGGDEGDLEPA